MSWKRYFNQVSDNEIYSRTGRLSGPAATNYSSYLPDVYSGSPNRVERYGQYNTMDMDSEVNAALDILAEFCSQINKQNDTNFKLDFKQAATNSEITILKQYLQQWCKQNNFNKRIFRIFRNVFKYGDAFFIKDPETSDLMVSFAKFAAIQHISEITTPQTPVEQVVDHMKIIAAITNLEISYPL